MKPNACDKKSVAFDTKSNENYRKSIRNREKFARKSIAFDEKLTALNTKSDGIYKKIEEFIRKSLGNQ